METVTLIPFLHIKMECIGIYSRQNGTLNYYFQKKAGAKWSKSNKCCFIPCTERNYEILVKVLKGIAAVDSTQLKRYLTERRKKGYSVPIPEQDVFTGNLRSKKSIAVHAKPVEKVYPVITFSKENKDALQKYMVLRN